MRRHYPSTAGRIDCAEHHDITAGNKRPWLSVSTVPSVCRRVTTLAALRSARRPGRAGGRRRSTIPAPAELDVERP